MTDKPGITAIPTHLPLCNCDRCHPPESTYPGALSRKGGQWLGSLRERLKSHVAEWDPDRVELLQEAAA